MADQFTPRTFEFEVWDLDPVEVRLRIEEAWDELGDEMPKGGQIMSLCASSVADAPGGR